MPAGAPLRKGGAALPAAFAAADAAADLGALLAVPVPRTLDAFVARLRALAARADPRFASYCTA